MTSLVFAPEQWSNLRTALLTDANRETAAALVVVGGNYDGGVRVVVRDIEVAEADDYLERSGNIASLSPSFVARALKRARLLGGGLVLAHSHPFQQDVHFSSVDDLAQKTLAPSLFARTPGPHGFLVVGPGGFEARLFDEEGKTLFEVDAVQEIGRVVNYIDRRLPDAEPREPFFDRNVRAFGRDGQLLLSQLRIGVVGVGGTGSIVVEELSRLGVGQILLIDPEIVEETNLNRLIGATGEDVGQPKVTVAARAASRARSSIVAKGVCGSILEEDVGRSLLACAFVFCCTDSHGSRAVLNQLSYQYRLPMIDVGVRIDAKSGVVAAMSTRVQMLAEGLACLNCYPLLDPNAVRRDLMVDPSTDPYIVGTFEPQPAVISINAATSSMAVSMFLSAMVGFPGDARHVVGRPIEGIVRPVKSNPNPSCVVCGTLYALAKGDTWPMIWRQS
ncbi:ThiF family adenylyltransferase [Mesorhizobium argentiipisi]|uniref:ThiF family adenylyltransferase n=1 Tax=Mesorhizobium argentiipisi TaxID=3015175 RepID=A0ABU8K7L1_9HYPH